MNARRKQRLAYSFHSETVGHRSGVTALALDATTRTLFSAGRDSTIRAWKYGQEEISAAGSVETHSDWVNDVVLMQGGYVVSCSSDCTVALSFYDADAQQFQVKSTIISHSDYVKKLCARGRDIYSAGLDSTVCVHHIREAAISSEMINAKHSIYSLGVSDDGNLIAVGGTEQAIRVFDIRFSGAELTSKFKGHTDVVRTICMSADGNRIVSGSADGAVKVWDLRMQRCVSTLNMHSDSVWAMWSDRDCNQIITGGRDKNVFFTSLADHAGRSVPICQSESSILSVVASFGDSVADVWVSGLDPSVRMWNWDFSDAINPSTDGDQPSKSHKSTDIPHMLSTPANSSLIKFSIVNNRYQILTQANDGAVQLWNVLTMAMDKDFGVVDFDKKFAELQQEVVVANWFSADIKNGHLTITLDNPQCFDAEQYLSELGFGAQLIDKVVSPAPLIIHALLKGYLDSKRPRNIPITGPNDQSEGQAPPAAPEKELPEVHIPPECWISIYDDNKCLLRRRVGAWTGKEQIPLWVTECLATKAAIPRGKDEVPFLLQGVEGEDLPQIGRGAAFSARKLMRISKLVNFICDKIFSTPAERAAAEAEEAGGIAIDLFCKGRQLTDLNITLIAIKQFYWKSSSDMVLQWKPRLPLNKKSGR